MKKTLSTVRKIMYGIAIIFLVTILSCVGYYYSVTFSTKLNADKIKQAQASNIELLDCCNNLIEQTSFTGKSSYINFDSLNQHTIDAFICVEDKRFFNHNGIDYIRILGAIKNNILNPNQKQGGSTITQQVIKNTQLSSEKTIKRKLKEFKLARQLENQYNKQEILEMYLNSIYFGNGCYGIAQASEYYFDKPASDLTIAQSALLASTINAPSIYDPVSNLEKASERKNLILKLMYNNKKITKAQLNSSKDESIIITKSAKKYKNQYYKGVISEACKLLKITENQLKQQNVKIETYYNPDIQAQLEDMISSGKYTSYSNSAKLGSIVLDNTTKSVVAFASNSGLNLLNTYRQPGSIIKPILVYAPAFETGKYTPSTFVCDEPLNINGYCPENAGKNYYGVVDIKTSIAKSLNIVPVKILSDIGINYAKNYAKKLGISFDRKDDNLALALGGFTKGTTIKQLSDAYMCFANGGSFETSSFIKSINKNDENIYVRKNHYNQAMKDSVSFLINDCLKETVLSGTAKRLKGLNIPVCSKTGTVGNNNGNTDAYNISYTTMHTICCWMGANDTSNALPSSVNGATYPTLFNHTLMQHLYKNNTPPDFDIPQSVVKVGLNEDALSEHLLESDIESQTFRYFDNRFIPLKTNRSKLDTTISINNFDNCKPIIYFAAKRDIVYEIYRNHNNICELLQTIKFTNDDIEFIDESAISGEIYEYYVISKNRTTEQQSNSIKLLAN